jgi:hypothetical protein
LVADQTAAMFDEWFEGPHRGAWGGEGRECVAMLEQERKREFRVRGIVLGVAGREGCPVRGQGPRIDGEQNKKCVLTPGIDERACIECEAHGNRASCEPLASGTCPLIDGRWLVLKNHELPFVVADGWSADIGVGIGPIEANEGGKFFVWSTCDVSPPEVCERGEKG